MPVTAEAATAEERRALLKQLRRLARALDLQSRRIDREAGLTLPQLVVLSCIGDMGEVTSRALSAEADLSPPTVVGVLDKLAAKGLIERYRSERDRRIVHARLTAKGRAALDAAPDPLGEAVSEGFSGLAPAERAQLLEALAAVARAVGAPAEG
jgi:DNA-binding MarR family transcriptional regulator